MGIHLCLQTLAGHFQRSMYSSRNPHFKALPKGSGENSPVQVFRMVLGWPRAGLAGCWECCGRCLWAEDKAPFCWRSSQVLSPLWAQSFSLQSSSPAVPAVLKGAVTAFSFSSQELWLMARLCGAPEPLPCQGTLTRHGASPHCCRVNPHASPGLLCQGMFLNLASFSALWNGNWGSTQDPCSCSFSPPFPLHAGLYQLWSCLWWGKKGIILFLTVILLSLLLWKHVCA